MKRQMNYGFPLKHKPIFLALCCGNFPPGLGGFREGSQRCRSCWIFDETKEAVVLTGSLSLGTVTNDRTEPGLSGLNCSKTGDKNSVGSLFRDTKKCTPIHRRLQPSLNPVIPFVEEAYRKNIIVIRVLPYKTSERLLSKVVFPSALATAALTNATFFNILRFV